MSIKTLVEYIKNNDFQNFVSLLENNNIVLTPRICTILLVYSLKYKKYKFSNYILIYDFDLDSDTIEKYLQSKKFNKKEIDILNKIFNNKLICCLIPD